MNDKQYQRYSVQREKLIRKMERENPLRPISGHEHAMAVISASNRHKLTNYDSVLAYAHFLEDCGEIERGAAKDYARTNMIMQ